MYASLALGIVLVHRVTGIVNFAHGAMAMLTAYAFVSLRPAWGMPGALAGAIVVAAGVGLLVHVGVFAHLAGRPPVAGVAASVGVLTTLQALATLVFGAGARPVAALLPSGPVSVLGAIVPVDRLLLAGLAGGGTVGLWALFRFTRFGLACRAAAEDPTNLALLGWSPAALGASTWVLAAVLGGLGAVVAGPVTALDPVTSTLLVVPALGAALGGRMASFGWTTVAAFGIGIGQSLLLVAQDRIPAMPRTGLREALPLAVIVVALAAGGRRLDRDPAPGARLPPAPPYRPPWRAAVVGSAVAGIALLVLDELSRLALTTSLIGAVLCLSLVLLTGYAGQVSLAQMAFAGLAGFTITRLAGGLDLPVPLPPLAGALVAGAAGVVVGLPSLRLRGTSLAVVTLASAVAVEDLVFKNPALTGGFGGAEVPDLGLGPASSPAFGLLVLAVTVAVALAVARLRGSRFGRRCLAVRADEGAAAACGVDVAATRLVAFTLSAFVAGVGGALLAYSQVRLSFGSFGVFVSLSLLAVAWLGGIVRVSGAVVGGLLVGGGLVFGTLDRIAGLGRYQLVVTGATLVAAVVLRPEGLTATAARSTGLLARALGRLRPGPARP